MNPWESTRVPNLFRYRPSGEYAVRRRIGGRSTRVYLGTKVFTVARWKAAEYMKASAPRRIDGSVEQLANDFIASVDSDPSMKPKTKHCYRQRLDALRRTWPSLFPMRPGKVTEAVVREWASAYLQKYSASNYNATVGVLRRIFDLAVERGFVAESPAAKLALSRHPRKSLRLPTHDQFVAMVAAIRRGGSYLSPHCANLVEFLAYSGCRVFSEARWATWGDVDFQAGAILIRGNPLTGTKNSDVRTIPMIGEMRGLLERMGPKKPGDRILRVMVCTGAMRRACDELGIDRLTHHDLRHLFATRCLQSGVDVPTVAAWLGHRDGGALLLKVYSHVLRAHSMAMAARVQVGQGPAGSAGPQTPRPPGQPPGHTETATEVGN